MSELATPFLAKIGLHTPLGAAEKAALAGVLTRPVTWKRGALLADAGDPLDTATIVLDGMVARAKHLPDGRRQVLSLLLPGDLIDAHASVLRKRVDVLEAISDVTAAIVPQSRVLAIGAEFPRLHEAFLREAFIEASVAREWVVNLGQRTAPEALAHLLCELCVRFDGVGLGKGGRYPFPLKQQQLADCLGLSLIHLNRVMQQLRSTGLIQLEGRSLTVVDREGLRRLANFRPDYLYFDASQAA